MANIFEVEATGYPQPVFSLDEPNYAHDSYHAEDDPEEVVTLEEVSEPEGESEFSGFEELLESFEEPEKSDEPDEPEGGTSPEVAFDLGDLEPEVTLEEQTEGAFVSEQPADSQSTFDDLMNADQGMLPGAQVILFKKEKEEPVKETNWEDDSDHSKFIDYVATKLRGIPPHSGQTTVGCEKAISYLRKIDKEISKAIQSDEENVISEEQAESLRDKIHEFVDQLEEAFDQLVDTKRKKKKKASFSVGKTVVARINNGRDIQYFVSVANTDGDERLLKVDVEEPTDEEVKAFLAGEGKGLTKEAGALHVFVDPFLQSIKRLLIRSHITQGKNIQDVYNQLNDQYNFTDREQLSIHELLLQSGLPLLADLGRIHEKDVSPMDSRNVEFSTEFYS